MRPSCPKDYDRDDVDEHRNDDDDNDDEDHHGAVETNARESDRADCYLALFANTTIQYVVAAMVQWPMGAEHIFAGDLNLDLERTGGVLVATLGLEDISAHYLPQWRVCN